MTSAPTPSAPFTRPTAWLTDSIRRTKSRTSLSDPSSHPRMRPILDVSTIQANPSAPLCSKFRTKRTLPLGQKQTQHIEKSDAWGDLFHFQNRLKIYLDFHLVSGKVRRTSPHLQRPKGTLQASLFCGIGGKSCRRQHPFH